MLGVEAQMVIDQRKAMFMLRQPEGAQESAAHGDREGQGCRPGRGGHCHGRNTAQGRLRLKSKGAGQSPAAYQALSAVVI